MSSVEVRSVHHAPRHDMKTFSYYCPFVKGIHRSSVWFPTQKGLVMRSFSSWVADDMRLPNIHVTSLYWSRDFVVLVNWAMVGFNPGFLVILICAGVLDHDWFIGNKPQCKRAYGDLGIMWFQRISSPVWRISATIRMLFVHKLINNNDLIFKWNINTNTNVPVIHSADLSRS